MRYDITIETVEMNHIMVTSEEGATRFYDLYTWTLGEAVENYIETELME